MTDREDDWGTAIGYWRRIPVSFSLGSKRTDANGLPLAPSGSEPAKSIAIDVFHWLGRYGARFRNRMR